MRENPPNPKPHAFTSMRCLPCWSPCRTFPALRSVSHSECHENCDLAMTRVRLCVLRLRATACSELGYYSLALTHWEECISFAATHCPPHDESMVCYSIHAALAALAAGQREVAAAHAEVAARTPQRNILLALAPKTPVASRQRMCCAQGRIRWRSEGARRSCGGGMSRRSGRLGRCTPRRCGSSWKLRPECHETRRDRSRKP